MASSRSYSSLGVRRLVTSVTAQYAAHGDAPGQVDELLRGLEELGRELRERYSFNVEGKRVLDIGAGQRLARLAYFARQNEAIGIDLDVVPQSWDFRSYIRMLRCNGFERTLKTIGRKSLRLDARFYRAYEQRIGHIPRLNVLQMDAASLAFADGTFDFVHSYSVFQHLPDPDAVVQEVARVLAPGGVFYALLHLYSSRNGSLDPRYANALWPHLRGVPVNPPTYLNRLRLSDWRRVFAALPGSDVVCRQPEREALEPEVERFPELAAYDVDELVTHDISVFWQKPNE